MSFYAALPFVGRLVNLSLPASWLDIQLVHIIVGWLEGGRHSAQGEDVQLVLAAGGELAEDSGSLEELCLPVSCLDLHLVHMMLGYLEG